VTVSASPTVGAPPSTDLATALAGLQDAVAQLGSALTALQSQLGTGAAAGAATLAGGPGGSASGCSCSGAKGALEGAGNVGQAPPAKGDSGVSGADGAPQAAKADAPKKSDKADANGGGSTKGEQLVAEARKHLGAKYVYGAEGPDSFDCSGLVQFAAKKLGIDLPRVASAQATQGKAVDKGDLKPGDLVYFSEGSGVSHIGIYAGDGKYIHAPKPGDVVKVSSLNDSWAKSHYAGARRVT
jgi:cell wall-associated NlpC family hydrolase